MGVWFWFPSSIKAKKRWNRRFSDFRKSRFSEVEIEKKPEQWAGQEGGLGHGGMVLLDKQEFLWLLWLWVQVLLHDLPYSPLSLGWSLSLIRHLPPFVHKEALLASCKGLQSQRKPSACYSTRQMWCLFILLFSPQLNLLQSLYYSPSVTGVLSLNLELHKRKSGETVVSLWVPHYLSQGNEGFWLFSIFSSTKSGFHIYWHCYRWPSSWLTDSNSDV